MMRRRQFIALLGGAMAWPLTARAQQRALPVIGFLRAGQPPKSWVASFQQGLRERGYVNGQNIVVEFRFTDGGIDQLPQLAEELVRLKVDVILASAPPAALAAKKATTSVPIVFVLNHPVEIGLVPSLGRPGGNITGLAAHSPEIASKRLELLTELVPKLGRVAVLLDQRNPTNQQLQLGQAEVAARTLGVRLEPVPVRGPSDFDSAFEAMRGADGLLLLDSSLFTTHRARLLELVAISRLPAVYPLREMTEVGGLMSYGADLPDLYRRVATHVDKILKGAKPADLPVEQPTKFELVINLKTAKALGITVPPTLLARADEVIE